MPKRKLRFVSRPGKLFQSVCSGGVEQAVPLRRTATEGGNVFDALMTAVRSCSLGQISDAFFEVGGQYRRNV